MGKKGLGGSGLSMSAGTVLVFGGVVGMIADAMWYSLGLPGGTAQVPGCGILKQADIIQIGLTGFLTFIGFMTGNKILPAVTFGIMSGMLIPKIIMPYLGLPRYGLFDIDQKTGSVKPVARF